MIVYEGGSVLTQARSLWRLELGRTKWSGGYVNWYHPMRIRHITTGMYLGVNGEVGITPQSPLLYLSCESKGQVAGFQWCNLLTL